jgi:tRNA (cmo5U34)-methyltransferase
MSDLKNSFSNPQFVAKYAEGPPRFVPGYTGMLSMVRLLLAERVSNDARVLVLGAGGGLEMKAFAQAQPGWTFNGVDPSAEMLELARQTLGPLVPRARLNQGYIHDAPEELFDAATCLLTLHFVPPNERLHTVAEVHRRLKPGAPFAVVHFSIPQGDGERSLWSSRYAAFVTASGVDPDVAAKASEAPKHLHILTPDQDEAVLREAGFSNVTLFYTGFTFRGWVAYA